jgi:4-hydroxy-tetrahydrodipicolinate reductase
MNPTRIIVTGSKGRMGQTIIGLASKDPELKVVGQVDLGDDINACIGNADAVIDFSFHSATLAIVEAAAKNRKAIVIGTTGHSDDEKFKIKNHKSHIPIVWAANFSVGVNLLFALTRKAAEVLGDGYDQEVVEMHHRLKKDAPSGTAARLAEILAEVKKEELKKLARHGREGIVGERTSSEIGIHAIRGGDVIGDHTVIYAGIGERVELTHKASSRDTFAKGALRAAKWIVGQKPGLYDMQDVLGLR